MLGLSQDFMSRRTNLGEIWLLVPKLCLRRQRGPGSLGIRVSGT